MTAPRSALLGLLLGLSLGVTQPAKTAAPVAKFCTGCDFSGASLQSSDYSGGTYIGNNFERADLRNSSFRQATLVAANFQGADLRGVAFDASQCTACNFDGAKLDGATFAGSRMVAGNFAGFSASVTDAALRDLLGGCVSCNFTGANLSARNFSGLTLISVDFTKADLRGTDFSGAALCWYTVTQKKRTVACDSFAGANVSAANLSNVVVCENPLERQGCSIVDDDLLRRYTKSALDGALTSSPG
jgi:uncharacterized protein YjbI with pentapeptide repeats